MSIYLPSLTHKIADTISGLKANWEDYIAHKDKTAPSAIVDHNLDEPSPENGYYIVYGNGIVECWHEITLSYITGTAMGGTWILPFPIDSSRMVDATITLPTGFAGYWNIDDRRRVSYAGREDVSDDSISFRIRPIVGESFTIDNEVSNANVRVKGFRKP